jgi:Protein of unknown function (DUF2950)
MITRLLRCISILPLTLIANLPLAAQPGTGQKTFAKSSEAATALIVAIRSGDQNQLLAVLGPNSKDLIDSGDPIADKKSRDNTLKMYDAKHSLVTDAPGYRTLVIGTSDYPLPIPIVRDGLVWYFDSNRGREEIINRRIGKNELGAIAVCEGYVAAQKEYAARGHDGLPAGIYAQKLASTPGKQDGLYWPVAAGKKQSPLGPAIADSEAEGYTTSAVDEPYHGYLYKLLKAQGPDAQGGAKSYLANGKLSGGFALLAYPASYGAGGIMTFLVDQDGVIYQKDLGDDTANAAPKITTYNPDASWTPVE